ncbi:MAG: two-component system response regulator [Rhodopirellula sp. JB055]|uniref:response regulator n=1 Tax=Rhodopirellula sp. JB055 TaxID=3342846 RepID=UPI00370CB274
MNTTAVDTIAINPSTEPLHGATTRRSSRRLIREPKFLSHPRVRSKNGKVTKCDDWVLCIDDDSDFSYSMKLSLQNRGYKVARAQEARAGYQLAFEFEPIAILLDLMMADQSGEDLLAEFRFHPALMHIPVFIVTGVYSSNSRDRLLASGASDVFRKPVDLDAITEAIEYHRPTS